MTQPTPSKTSGPSNCIKRGCTPSPWRQPDMPQCHGHLVQICVNCGRVVTECFVPPHELEQYGIVPRWGQK